MKQFKTILSFELSNYFKDKLFIGITVFLVAVIAVVMFFPRFTVGSDDNNSTSANSNSVMLISAKDETLSKQIAESFKPVFTDYNVKAVDYDLKSIKASIKNESAECAFVFDSADSYTYYVNNLQMTDVNTEIADEILKSISISDKLIQSGLSAEKAQEIMGTAISYEVQTLGVDQINNFFYTYIMVFALYMVIVFYGQMISNSVAMEKSSRAMELLITSAKPTSLMFGKIIAACLAGLTQLICVFGSSIIFYNLNKSYWGDNMIINSIFNMPVELFAYMLIFFILGLLIYAFMYGAIGSMVSKVEELNTAAMPVTLIFIASFLVVVFSMSSGEVDNLLMKVCSFIPFTSPMAMFTRIAMSTVPVYEIIISVIILIASVFLIGFGSAKIYKTGVMLYGTKPNLKNMIKTVFGK